MNAIDMITMATTSPTSMMICGVYSGNGVVVMFRSYKRKISLVTVDMLNALTVTIVKLERWLHEHLT